MVYNPKSGSAPSRSEITAWCRAADVTVERFVAISESLEADLKPFIRKGSFIAAIGGDGTINAVANLVVGTKATLVPLPGGTFNHFTKDAGVPQDLGDAVMRLRKLKPRLVDVGSVNGTYFLNNSSLGLHPISLRERQILRQRVTTKLAIPVGAIKALWKFHAHKLVIDGKPVRTPFVFVGNNRYGISGGVPERTALTGGELSVFIARTHSPIGFLKIIVFTLFGKRLPSREFSIHSTKRLTIDSHRSRLLVSYDGEVIHLAPPLAYKIHTRKLRILA